VKVNDATPVERAELLTRDVELVTSMVREQYVGHAATFRCAEPAAADGQVRTAAVNGLMAGWLGYGGFEYTVHGDPMPAPTTVTVMRGSGSITTRREHRRFTVGDVIMVPADQHSSGTMANAGYITLQVPWATLRSLAEEHHGVPGEYLRFESVAAVSVPLQGVYATTASLVYDHLVASHTTSMHPVLVEHMTRLAAAAMLTTFPNTTMTIPYLPSPGWAAPATVRDAAAYIDAHAHQPVTVPEIAAAAGLTVRALQDAFRRHYGITPVRYLRRVRLEYAHLELHNADPRDGVTVASVARKWGWASASRFAAAYQQRFSVPPGHTLRY
jgi:AraC-like DNA-binding protein